MTQAQSNRGRGGERDTNTGTDTDTDTVVSTRIIYERQRRVGVIIAETLCSGSGSEREGEMGVSDRSLSRLLHMLTVLCRAPTTATETNNNHSSRLNMTGSSQTPL